MLRSAAVALVQQKLGFRTDLQDQIVVALQEAQAEAEGAATLPWFLVQESQTLAITSGSQTATLPTGYIKTVEGEGPHFTNADDDAVFLIKRPYAEGYAYYADATAAAPKSYSIRKSSVHIWPEPDKAYSLFWSYYKVDSVLSADIENQWLANVPYLLIGRAGMLIAEDTQQETGPNSAYDRCRRLYSTWHAWLMARMAEREDDDMPRSMGRNQ